MSEYLKMVDAIFGMNRPVNHEKTVISGIPQLRANLYENFDEPRQFANGDEFIEALRELQHDGFTAILQEIKAMHDKKSQDYGRPADPYANVRASQDFGIPAWVGTLVRANDKMRRLQSAAQGSTMANESIEDSLLDLAVYAIIALDLYRKENNA